jgi:cytoskeleton protein RodZ
MMSQSVNKPDVETAKKDADFGKQLREARKAQNYTVEEISGHIKVPVQTLKVIEASDLDKLPVPTFAQGYIRAYAKFLEISEDSVLEKYNLAVPHQEEATLRPRSKLPGEASSQSPLVKSITMLLMLAGIAAVIFGSFKYYQEKAGAMEEELDNRDQSLIGNSLDSPGSNRLSVEQDSGLADDGGLVVEQSDSYQDVPAAGVDQDISADANDTGSEIDAVTEEVVIEQPPENDIIEFFAENGSWMEVRDVNKSRLFYNMIPVGGSKVIVGKAPFNVTMGNAKTTRVVINDLEVDMTDHIRPNNTAVFNVSTNGQDIIIH